MLHGGTLIPLNAPSEGPQGPRSLRWAAPSGPLGFGVSIFIFLAAHHSVWVLVCRPGMDPTPPALGDGSPNHGPAREAPGLRVLYHPEGAARGHSQALPPPEKTQRLNSAFLRTQGGGGTELRSTPHPPNKSDPGFFFLESHFFLK